MCYYRYRIVLTSCSQVTILVLGGGLALMTQSKYTSTPSRMSDATRDFPIRIFTWGGSKQKKKVKAWIASLSSCWWKVYAKANIRISIGKKVGVCVCIASPYFSFQTKKVFYEFYRPAQPNCDYDCGYSTVWKFSNFPATLILHHINSGWFQRVKNCLF